MRFNVLSLVGVVGGAVMDKIREDVIFGWWLFQLQVLPVVPQYILNVSGLSRPLTK